MIHATLLTTLCTLAQTSQQQPGDEGTGLLVWAVILLGVAVALFFIEIFVPSGGIVGGLSAIALIIGIIMLFRVDTTFGLVGAILAILALPFALGFAMKMWPHTPIGRMLILQGEQRDTDDDGEGSPDASARAHPAARPVDAPPTGAVGRAISDLRPVGTCVFEGKRYECLAVGGTIAHGSEVRVIAVDGMHIKVQAVSP